MPADVVNGKSAVGCMVAQPAAGFERQEDPATGSKATTAASFGQRSGYSGMMGANCQAASGCCARAASGNAAAMNSRLLMGLCPPARITP
jgi:hypothetical protein